jgi:starch synthase
VVRATGGLKDTIEEYDPVTGTGNGFVFGPYTPGDFMEAVERALSLFYRQEAWTALMRKVMTADFSWARSAKVYKDLYHKLSEI